MSGGWISLVEDWSGGQQMYGNVALVNRLYPINTSSLRRHTRELRFRRGMDAGASERRTASR